MASIRAGLESVEAEVEVPPVAATQSEPSASGPPRFVALLDPTPAYRKGLAVALAEAGFKPAEPVDLREWLLSVPDAMVLLTIIDELDSKSVLADAASANARSSPCSLTLAPRRTPKPCGAVPSPACHVMPPSRTSSWFSRRPPTVWSCSRWRWPGRSQAGTARRRHLAGSRSQSQNACELSQAEPPWRPWPARLAVRSGPCTGDFSFSTAEWESPTGRRRLRRPAAGASSPDTPGRSWCTRRSKAAR